MMYQAVSDGFATFASKAGADTHPDWFRNLKSIPGPAPKSAPTC